MDMKTHLTRQAAFSRATFGPGARTEGVLDHIAKEAREVRDASTKRARAEEWTDIAILALDGLWRACQEHMSEQSGHPINHADVASMACDLITRKQNKNELRDWPDWRSADPEKAIEHDRTRGVQ